MRKLGKRRRKKKIGYCHPKPQVEIHTIKETKKNGRQCKNYLMPKTEAKFTPENKIKGMK